MALTVREIAIYDESFEANADMTGDQYKIVKLHTVAGQVVLAGAGEGIGVLQNKPEAGQKAQVRIFGLTRIILQGSTGGNLEPGNLVKSDANGLGTRSSVAGDLPIGTATGLVTADGVIDTMLMTGPLRVHA